MNQALNCVRLHLNQTGIAALASPHFSEAIEKYIQKRQTHNIQHIHQEGSPFCRRRRLSPRLQPLRPIMSKKGKTNRRMVVHWYQFLLNCTHSYITTRRKKYTSSNCLLLAVLSHERNLTTSSQAFPMHAPGTRGGEEDGKTTPRDVGSPTLSGTTLLQTKQEEGWPECLLDDA